MDLMAAGLGLGVFNYILATAELVWEWKWNTGQIRRLRRQELILFAGSLLLVFYGNFMYGGITYQTVKFWLLSSLLMTAAWIDWKERIVPDQLLVIYGILLVIHRLLFFDAMLLADSLLGAAAGSGILLAAYMCKKDSVGLGDVKLMVLCGWAAGLMGVLSLLFRAVLFAAVVSGILLLRKKAQLKTELPFVPFLFLGSLF